MAAFRQDDVFTANFDEATVVTVYLFPSLLKRLLPKLEQLKAGTRIVSHQFAIPDVVSNDKFTVQSTETGDIHSVYIYITPLKK